MTAKRCCRCGATKDRSEFYADRSRPDGLSYQCRPCVKLRRAELAQRKEGPAPIPPIEQRFWAKVHKAAACWLWTAQLDPKGYGRFWYDGRSREAYRFAYELLIGPIPEGLVLDHLCRNPRCVNPAHLEPVTRGENVLRGTGPTAANAAKTHCKRGHPLSGENLYVRPGGQRHCRTCMRERYVRTTELKGGGR